MVALVCPSVKTTVSVVVTKMELSGGEMAHVAVTVPTVPESLKTSTRSSAPSLTKRPWGNCWRLITPLGSLLDRMAMRDSLGSVILPPPSADVREMAKASNSSGMPSSTALTWNDRCLTPYLQVEDKTVSLIIPVYC